MRALTVRQPWAWAIIHAEPPKDVENRTRNIAGSYRGPVAIHAGLREDEAAYDDEMIRQALGEYDDGWLLAEQVGTLGAIVGVVDLVDVHTCRSGCCRSPWAEREPVVQTWRGPLGQTRSTFRVHLLLANPRPLAEPIPCRGALGLWTPPADVLDRLEAAL